MKTFSRTTLIWLISGAYAASLAVLGYAYNCHTSVQEEIRDNRAAITTYKEEIFKEVKIISNNITAMSKDIEYMKEKMDRLENAN